MFFEFVTILLLFYILVFWPGGMWNFSSPTRDWTHTPCIGRGSLNHWTTREVLPVSYIAWTFAVASNLVSLFILASLSVLHIVTRVTFKNWSQIMPFPCLKPFCGFPLRLEWNLDTLLWPGSLSGIQPLSLWPHVLLPILLNCTPAVPVFLFSFLTVANLLADASTGWLH